MRNKDIRWWNRDIEPRTVWRCLLLILLFPVVVIFFFAIGLFRSGNKGRYRNEPVNCGTHRRSQGASGGKGKVRRKDGVTEIGAAVVIPGRVMGDRILPWRRRAFPGRPNG